MDQHLIQKFKGKVALSAFNKFDCKHKLQEYNK